MAAPWEKYGNPAAQYGPDPVKVRQQQMQEEDQIMQRDAAMRAAQAAERANSNSAQSNALQQIKVQADLAKDGLMIGQNGEVVANPKGKIGGKSPANDPQRAAQIKSLLDVIRRTRTQANDFLAVGEQSKNVREWPLVGGMLGQNRADVEGLVKSIEGDLIQQQIARLSQQNGGNGVASIANSETEAARMASAIANLSLDQGLPEFQAGLQRAEDYYRRQLAEIPADQNTLRNSLGIQVDPAMIAGQQGGGDRSLGNVGGPLYGDPTQPLGGGASPARNDIPQDIATRGGVPLGAGGQGSDFDIRWGGGPSGEFDRAAWLKKEYGWSVNDEAIAMAWANANTNKQLTAAQIKESLGRTGITVPDFFANGMAARLGRGRDKGNEWTPAYSAEQAAWDKRVEELKKQRKNDVVNPVLRGVADTGLMGQADKIFALTDTVSGGTYQENLNERYATNAADEQVNPYLRMTGQGIGGVAPTVGLYKGVGSLGANLAARGGRAGAVAETFAGTSGRAGTTANTLYGSGYGAASDTDPLRGAGIGALSSFAGDKLGGYIGKKVVQSPLLTSIRNKGSGLIGGRKRATLQTPPTDQMILNADVGDVAINKLSRAKDLQVPMTLADTTPEFRALAGATARRSPTARGMAEESFVPRQRGQYDRLIGAIDRDLGPTANIPQYSDDLIKQAQSNARPLYDEAFSSPGASSVDISGIAKTPMGQQGINNAYNSVRNTLGPDGQPIDATALGFDIAEGTGEAMLNRVPSFETLDYFKKGLDDVIDAGFDPMTKQYTADARAAIQLKQNLVSQIDNVNPSYAAARQAYAGPAGEREALRLGQSSGNMSPDQLRFTTKDYSPEKMQQFALGDRSRMAEQAGKVRYSSNPWESALGTPQARQRLDVTHPNASPRFGEQYGMERDIAISNNAILGNSMTAERQLADQAFGGSMLSDMAFDAATTGAPIKTGATFLSRFAKDELGRMGARKKADLLAPILFNPDAAEAANQLVRISGRAKAVRRGKGILGNRAARYGGRAGGATGAALAIPFFDE